MKDLSERVWAVISTDHGPLEGVGLGIANKGELSSFELDVRDRGMLYGVAWTMARGEDPFESPESVQARAQGAARVAWMRWDSSGTVERPEKAEVAV